MLAGAAGFITGILTAPKSGKETRKELAEKTDELKEQTAADLKKATDELSDMIKAAKDKSLALSAQARSEFNEAVIRAKDARNKAVHVFKAFKSGSSEDRQLNSAIKQVKLARKNLAKYLKK